MSKNATAFKMVIFSLLAAPLRQRIQQLQEENRALRNGQPYTPTYLHDYPSNTGASQNYISSGLYTKRQLHSSE